MYFEKAGEWKYFTEGFDFRKAIRDELIKRYRFSQIPEITGKDMSNVLKTLFKISYGQDKLFSKYITITAPLSLDPDVSNTELIRKFKNKMLELLNDLSFYERHQELISLDERGEAKKSLEQLLNSQILVVSDKGVKLKSSLSSEEKIKIRQFNLKVLEELYPDVLRVRHKNSMDSKALNTLLKSVGLPEFSNEILDSAKQRFFNMAITPSTTYGNFLEKIYVLLHKDFRLTALQINDLMKDPEFLEMWNQKLCILKSLKGLNPNSATEHSS